MEARWLEHDWFSRPLPENVTIGTNSWLYSSFAFLHFGSESTGRIVIGNNTGIYKGTFFDIGANGSAKIGDYCTIVGAILNTNSSIIIGDYVLIAHEVTITHSAFATPRHDETIKSCDIVIGDNVWIGARSIILGGARIGQGTVIGAASVVDSDVPALSVVAGNPARVVKKLA